MRDGNGRYMFDSASVKGESAGVRQHLKVIIGYCKEYSDAHDGTPPPGP